jgi:hypothetical protein
MRYRLALVLVVAAPACALFAKSPVLSNPLHDQLAKADTPNIADAAKACYTRAGWKPDDVTGDAEGATVVSATNATKERSSVYIQPPGQNPRVTGDPAYDDPFWPCLGREVSSPKPAAAASADTP